MKKTLTSIIAGCLYLVIILPIIAFTYIPMAAKGATESNMEVVTPSEPSTGEQTPSKPEGEHTPYVPNFSFESEDLWNKDNNTMNKDVFKQLLDNLVGKTNSTKDDVAERASKNSTAEDFRTNCGQDLSLNFGGLNWTPVYLSNSEYNGGDIILTILLTDDNKLNHNVNTLYSRATRNPDLTIDYPTNLYGTSYIRSAYLNIGSYYLSAKGYLTYNRQSEDNNFAMFTMPKFGLTDYIVTPEYVPWQKSGQNAKELFGFSFNLKNENWGKISDDNFTSPKYNYSNKDYYDDWKSDYIWMPSISETGYENHYGIWKLSNRQIEISEDSKMGWKGDTYYTMLRSTSSERGDTFVTIGGTGDRDGGAYYLSRYVDMAVIQESVRPALHLNLTKIMNELGI